MKMLHEEIFPGVLMSFIEVTPVISIFNNYYLLNTDWNTQRIPWSD